MLFVLFVHRIDQKLVLATSTFLWSVASDVTVIVVTRSKSSSNDHHHQHHHHNKQQQEQQQQQHATKLRQERDFCEHSLFKTNVNFALWLLLLSRPSADHSKVQGHLVCAPTPVACMYTVPTQHSCYFPTRVFNSIFHSYTLF